MGDNTPYNRSPSSLPYCSPTREKLHFLCVGTYVHKKLDSARTSVFTEDTHSVQRRRNLLKEKSGIYLKTVLAYWTRTDQIIGEDVKAHKTEWHKKLTV